jgi:hypothetical protein
MSPAPITAMVLMSSMFMVFVPPCNGLVLPCDLCGLARFPAVLTEWVLFPWKRRKDRQEKHCPFFRCATARCISLLLRFAKASLRVRPSQNGRI